MFNQFLVVKGLIESELVNVDGSCAATWGGCMCLPESHAETPPRGSGMGEFVYRKYWPLNPSTIKV